MNEAFQADERVAGDLITHNLKNWGNQTCLSLAVLSHLLEFVAHPCCQLLLTEKWTDALQFTGSQILQVKTSLDILNFLSSLILFCFEFLLTLILIEKVFYFIQKASV